MATLFCRMSDGICSQRSLRSRSNRRLSEGLTAGVTASPPKRGKSDKENVAAQKHTSSKRRSVPIRSNVLKGASLENKSNLNTNNIVLDSGFQSFKSENSDSIRNSQDDNASTRCTYTGNVSTLHKEKPSANYDTTLSDTSDEDCEVSASFDIFSLYACPLSMCNATTSSIECI